MIEKTFLKSKPMIEKTFCATGDWKALDEAEKWCNENNVSIGYMQGYSPRGLKYGNYSIEKWRNLSQSDIEFLDGQMDGDMRNGPIRITIKEPQQE